MPEMFKTDDRREKIAALFKALRLEVVHESGREIIEKLEVEIAGLFEIIEKLEVEIAGLFEVIEQHERDAEEGQFR